jgi:hypothetical protein
MINTIKNNENSIIVTDQWNIAQESASLFYEKKFLFTENTSELEKLISILKEKGFTEFSFFTKQKNKDYENLSQITIINETRDIYYYDNFKIVEMKIK